jgi:hypothetical protein
MAGFIFSNAHFGLQKFHESLVQPQAAFYNSSLVLLGGKVLKYLLGDRNLFGNTV